MKADIIIISLGTGDPELLNTRTVSAIRNTDHLILRTGRHPLTAWLEHNHISFLTLDHLYESADDFDQLNDMIAQFIFDQAFKSQIVYAVPDAFSDHSVKTLFRMNQGQFEIAVIPGQGTTGLYLSASMPYLQNDQFTIVTAYDLLASQHCDPNQTLLITELDNPVLAGQIKLFLSDYYPDEQDIYLINGNAAPSRLQLFQLDRHQEIDHFSAILLPGSGYVSRKRFVMNDLTSLMDRLRSPEGCPWDRIQTHQSLRPYMIEEAWECIASIDEEDTDHLCEELGDLLFQVVFHASIGKTFEEFTINDIISSICSKMIRRHPHVFGDLHFSNPDDVRTEWEKIKRQETGSSTIVSSLYDVSSALPSLKYASKVLKKLNQAESLYRNPCTIASEIENTLKRIISDSDLTRETSAGQLLLLCTELCNALNCDSEILLRQSVDRFRNSLQAAEKLIIRDGKSLEHLTFEELGVYLKHVEGEIE